MKTSFSSEQEFIKIIAPAAQKACKRYGYLPSVLIAQACLENGYGIPSYWDNQEIKYLLQYNNMVGQKAELLTSSWYDKSVWPGKSFNKNTPEVYSGQQVTIKDNFRIFDNIEQSFCDFILFLLYASNYGYNGKPKYGKEVVNIKDPATLIKEVGGRGYATGPTYPSSVMKIVNKHNLTQYDDLSTVEASNYIPDALRNQYKTTGDNKMNITEKTIYDVTAQNRSQVPASRGNNPIQWIVVHYLGVANADNENLYGGGYGGHYYVSRAGKIYKAADPRTAVVWQCGGGLQGSGGHQYHGICTNYNSIGIENGVCYDGTWYFTQETQESLVFLVSKLMDEYGIDINHVIRHYDVTGKICPAPYVNNDNYKTSWTWNQFKANLASYRGNVDMDWLFDESMMKDTQTTTKTETTTQKKEETIAVTADRVIAVAKAEVGYKEKASNSNLDNKTANAGSANYTKYARDFDQKYPNWYNGKKNGFAWCDMFVDWCFLTAFGYKKALELLCQPEKSAGAGCTYSYNYYKNKGQVGRTPKKGAQIFFGVPGDFSHTGLVYDFDNSNVYTIEGNTSDQVAYRQYSRSKSNIYYGYPNYSGSVNASDAGTDIPVSTSDGSLSIGMIGAAVETMQKMLIKLGYSCGKAGADGDFGNDTLSAVKKFQKENNLTVDGIYGPKSKVKLNELYKTTIEAKNLINQKSNVNTDYAKSFNKDIAKTYTTITNLRLRTGANTSKPVIAIIPKGDKVTCYGYYTDDWYYVKYNNYTGFCLKDYLQ